MKHCVVSIKRCDGSPAKTTHTLSCFGVILLINISTCLHNTLFDSVIIHNSQSYPLAFLNTKPTSLIGNKLDFTPGAASF